MTKLISAAILGWWLVLLSGCNTMHGLGQDIERGGEKLQDKAKR